MNISVEKLYEFLNSTSFLIQGDILELLDNMIEKNTTKVRWDGETYKLSADEAEREG